MRMYTAGRGVFHGFPVMSEVLSLEVLSLVLLLFLLQKHIGGLGRNVGLPGECHWLAQDAPGKVCVVCFSVIQTISFFWRNW